VNRRAAVLALASSAVLAANPSPSFASATDCATPTAGQPYILDSDGVIVLYGSGDLTTTVSVASIGVITVQIAYSGSGRFGATLTDPSGKSHDILTAISPKVGGTGVQGEVGDYVVAVTADAPWAAIIQ
jgi:hypothetical protein